MASRSKMALVRRCQLIEDKASTWQRDRRIGSARVLCGQRWRRDLSPDLEALLQFLPVCERSKPMPTRTEMLGDGTIRREEPLGVARGLEPLHVPLPLAGALMRILRPIVEIPVLAMF